MLDIVERAQSELLNPVAQKFMYGVLDGLLYLTEAADPKRLSRPLDQQRIRERPTLAATTPTMSHFVATRPKQTTKLFGKLSFQA